MKPIHICVEMRKLGIWSHGYKTFFMLNLSKVGPLYILRDHRLIFQNKYCISFSEA